MAKVLMIIAPVNFRDEEYFEPKKVLEENGHSTVTASTKTGTIQGSHGLSAIADVLITNVTAKDYDLILLVGGRGSYEYDDYKELHSLINDFYTAHKLVTAICHAPIILAKAGLLNGKNATVFAGDKEELIEIGAKYSTANVVKDGSVITANGPGAATAFGEEIVRELALSTT